MCIQKLSLGYDMRSETDVILTNTIHGKKSYLVNIITQ